LKTPDQRDELIVAAAVEREFFDLAFADKAGDVFGRNGDERGSRFDVDGLLDVAELEDQVDGLPLSDDEGDARCEVRRESRSFRRGLRTGQLEGPRPSSAGIVGDDLARGAGFQIFDLDGDTGNGAAGRIRDSAFDGRFALRESRRCEDCQKRESENDCWEKVAPLPFVNYWELHSVSPELNSRNKADAMRGVEVVWK